MVATPRKRASTASLLLAFLLAAPALPGPFGVASLADAQLGGTQAGIQLAIDQLNVTISQGSSTDTHFLGNGSFTVHVPVLNYGTAYTISATSPALPIFAWFEPLYWQQDGSFVANDTVSKIPGVCRTLPSLDAATPPPVNRPGSPATPSSTTIDLIFPATRMPGSPESGSDGWFPYAGFSIAIMVNRYPAPDGTSAHPSGSNPAFAGGSCANDGHHTPQYGVGSTAGAPGTCATNTTRAGPDCDGGDNVGFAYFVKDAQWDLRMTDLQFCRGFSEKADCRDASDGKNRTDMNLGDGILYNTTRRADDWPCDNVTLTTSNVTLNSACRSPSTANPAPPNFGDSAPSNVYFEALVRNEATPVESAQVANATWLDDRDHAACNLGGPSYSMPQDPTAGAPVGYPQIDPTQRTTASGKCARIPYEMSLKISGPNLPPGGLDITGNESGSGFLPWGSNAGLHQDLNLTGLYGTYTLSARIDPKGKLPQTDRSNDYFNKTIEIAWTDLQTRIDTAIDPTHFSADPLHPAEYPVSTTFDIPIHVDFLNTGPAAPTVFVGTKHDPRPVNYSIWLDDIAHLVARGVCPSDACPDAFGARHADGTPYVQGVFANYTVTSNKSRDSSETPYLAPGKHTLYACVDCDPLNQTSWWSGDNRTFELNESNNLQALDIHFQNVGSPEIKDTFGGVLPRIAFNASYDPQMADSVCKVGACPSKGFHPHEDVNVTLNVSDADQPSLNVSFVFQLASNASVTRTYYPCPPRSEILSTPNCVLHPDGARYFVWINDFGFAGNRTVTTEDWTVFGNATNSGLHTTASGKTSFSLYRWKLQTEPEANLLYGLYNQAKQSQNAAVFDADGANYSYGDDTLSLKYWVHLTENLTGINNQPNVTSNIGLRVDFPRNQTAFYNGTTPNNWANLTSCTTTNPGIGGIDPTPGHSGTPLTCDQIGNFSSLNLASIRDRNGAGVPGRWNFTISLTDKGGDTRTFNRSILWIKEPPALFNATFSSHAVVSGDEFTVHLNTSDDFGVKAAFVNFSRQQPSPYNVTFALHDGTNPNPQSTLVNLTYNNTIQTGLDKMFGVAGTYSAWFSAVDEFGNWNTTTPEQLIVNDTKKPDLLAASLDHARQEVGLKVVFTLNATDESNMTAYLQVLRGSETVIPNASSNDTKVAMTRVSSGNFTYNATFSTEGSYVWNMWVEDSVGQRSDLRTGPLSISSNLGPRFDLSPELARNIIDGQLYTRAQPTLAFTVYDFDDVALDSISLKINDREVVPDNITRPGGDIASKGWVVTYSVPAAQRFHHLEVVRVNLTAIDRSDKHLQEWYNFTFVVDDVAPVTRLLDFTPRFRSEDRNIWNVSLQTQFSLVADDNDNLPTGVDRILYSIIGGGNNAATTQYSGPFSIGSTPGIYTGPRVYQIQFWAVDSVGNENRTHDSITVYVDDLPPSLNPFGALPQGRFINASFVDDHAGIDRAVVWYSTNNGPFMPLALDFNGGVWSAVLPEGKKGDVIAYYLQAWDRVNNTDTFGNASVPYSKYTVGNHVPEIKVTAPAEGSTIARVVDLTWAASDADNDPLTFTVFYRAPGKSQFVELAKVVGDARRYSLDSNKFADGQYTFRVTATDGTFVALSETTVTILNRGSAFGAVTPPPGEVAPGKGVILSVQITKAQAVVEARIYRSGKFVQSYPMNDEGRDGDAVANDGIYSVRVAFEQAGDYTVEFVAHYQEDGQTKDVTLADQAHFSVKLTPNAIFQQYGVILLLVGLLAVAGIAIAAVVLVRRR